MLNVINYFIIIIIVIIICSFIYLIFLVQLTGIIFFLSSRKSTGDSFTIY